MSKLLDLAVKAHGELERWNKVKSVRVAASITGAIWFVIHGASKFGWTSARGSLVEEKPKDSHQTELWINVAHEFQFTDFGISACYRG